MIRRMLAVTLMVLGAGLAAPGAARPRDVVVGPNVTIHVLDEGPSGTSTPALVLLPGWRLPATTWSRQIAHFSKDRRVIAIDSRSQGGSSKVTDGNTPEQRAQDLRRVLDDLHVRRLVLVGWSQGVQDVAAFVNRYGTANVAGLVLVDSTISTGAHTAETTPAAAVRTLETVRAYNADPEALTRGMLGAIISRPMAARDTDDLVEQMLRTPTAIGSTMLVADLLGTDRSAAISRFDRPTLIIASARSPELAEQQAMAARIRGAWFRVVQDAAHTVFVDQPDVFNSILDQFIRQQVTGSR